MKNYSRIYCPNCGKKGDFQNRSPIVVCDKCQTTFRHIYSGGIHILESLDQPAKLYDEPACFSIREIFNASPNMISSGKIRAFHEKLRGAWQLFEKEVIPKPVFLYDANDIAQHVRFALSNSMIRSFVCNIPPVLVDTLLLKGVWTIEQWFDYLDLLPNKRILISALFGSMLTTAEEIISLADFMIEELIIETSRKLALFSEIKQADLISRILEIDSTQFQFNSFWLVSHCSLFPQIRNQSLVLAFTAAKKFDNCLDRIRSIGRLYDDLSDKSQAEAQVIIQDDISEIFKKANNGNGSWGYFILSCLRDIPEKFYKEYLPQIIENIEKDDDPEIKVWSLSALHKMGQKEYFNKLFETTNSETKITCQLLITDINSEASIERTLNVLEDFRKQNIKKDEMVEISLMEISYHLVKKGRFNESVKIAQSISDTILQKFAFAYLLPHLPPDQSSKIANEYIVANIDFDNNSGDFQLLSKIGPFLDKTVRDSLIKEAFAAVEEISMENTPNRALDLKIPGFSVEERRLKAMSDLFLCLPPDVLQNLQEGYLLKNSLNEFQGLIKEFNLSKRIKNQDQPCVHEPGSSESEPFSAERIILTIENFPIMKDPDPGDIVEDWMWDDKTIEMQALIMDLAHHGYIDEALGQISRVRESYRYQAGFPRAYSLARLAPFMNTRQINRGLQIANEIQMGKIIAQIILYSCARDKNKSQELENLFLSFKNLEEQESFFLKIRMWPDDILNILGENLPADLWNSFLQLLDSENRYELEDVSYHLLSGFPEKLRKQLSFFLSGIPNEKRSKFIKNMFKIKEQLNNDSFIESFIDNREYIREISKGEIKNIFTRIKAIQLDPTNERNQAEDEFEMMSSYLAKLGFPELALLFSAEVKNKDKLRTTVISLAVNGHYEEAISLLQDLPLLEMINFP